MEIEFFTERCKYFPVSSLKDPSFRRPIKLISIVHRKSLQPLKPDRAYFLSPRSLPVSDEPSLFRMMKQSRSYLGLCGDALGDSFFGRHFAGMRNTSLQGQRSGVFTASLKRNYLMRSAKRHRITALPTNSKYMRLYKYVFSVFFSISNTSLIFLQLPCIFLIPIYSLVPSLISYDF
jgi:hypothetical protein